MSKLGGRKFLMAMVGIVLCVLWQAMHWDEKYLVSALGFVAVYTAGNVGSDVANKK